MEDPVDNIASRYDIDEDGLLSDTEVDAMNADFVSRFDTDGDNQLNAEEALTVRQRSKVTVVASSPIPTTPEAVKEFLQRFDRNSDGMIDEQEAGERRWKVMSLADTDRDGLVTADEWLAKTTRLTIGRPSVQSQ